MDKFQLGDIVKDTVTGYQGVVMCRTDWLHGCTRYGLQPTKLDKDGKPQDTIMFDEPQLVLVKAKKVERQTSTGGPRPPCETDR